MKLLLIASLICAFVAAPLVAEDRAVCAVCGPREGAGFEPVKASATYKGKTYYFCSLKCKVDFLKDPNQFLLTDVGALAPPFTLKTFDDREITLSKFRGKVVLLDFWATFCAPCITALPELQALQSRYSSRGFTVLGLTVDDRPNLVKKATERSKVSYPIVRSTPDVWNAYKVNALPALVLVGKDGRIVKRFGGEADKQLMIEAIEKELAAPLVAGR